MRTGAEKPRRALLLSRAEEHALGLRWREHGDVAARDRIVAAHDPLVAAFARRFRGFGVPREDLLQDGRLGLVKAAEKFDPHLGTRFATLAQWWVLAALQESVIRNASIVRPRTPGRRRLQFFAGPERPGILSLDARAGGARSNAAHGSGERSLGEMLAADAPDLDDLIDAERQLARLGQALCDLPPRQQRVVRARVLEEALLRTIAGELGVSKERVRQIEAKALARLRTAMGVA